MQQAGEAKQRRLGVACDKRCLRVGERRQFRVSGGYDDDVARRLLEVDGLGTVRDGARLGR